MTLRVCLLALLAATGVWQPVVGQAGPADAASAREQIAAQYRSWDTARTAYDRVVFERVLAPEFYVQLPGQRIPRDAFIEQIAVRPAGAILARFESRILTMTQAADSWVAVITEKLEYAGTAANNNTQRVYSLWITRDTWKNTGGRWTVVSSEAVSTESWGRGRRPPLPDWDH